MKRKMRPYNYETLYYLLTTISFGQRDLSNKLENYKKQSNESDLYNTVYTALHMVKALIRAQTSIMDDSILDRAMKVMSLEDLRKEAPIQVTDSALVYQSTDYLFINSMKVIKIMIENGVYPQRAWVYKPKTQDGELRKDPSWQAQRYHTINFIDFANLYNAEISPVFGEIYERTGLLPCIQLGTAHDGHHSWRMTLKLVDVMSGNADLITAYPPESLFGVRIVHSKQVNVKSKGKDFEVQLQIALEDMSEKYKKLAEIIQILQGIHLTPKYRTILCDKIKEILFGKNYIRYKTPLLYGQLTSPKRRDKDRKSLWNRMQYIQTVLESDNGIPYSIEINDKERHKVKKFKRKDTLSHKKILGKLFTACYEVAQLHLQAPNSD